MSRFRRFGEHLADAHAGSAAAKAPEPLVFLKPRAPGGPTHAEVLDALHGFGFALAFQFERRFAAVDLRLMWPAMNTIAFWIVNAQDYDGVACPVFSVAYPRGDVLAALGAFKLAFRRRFCDPTDSVRTALHAPATLYELLFHDALLRAPPRTNGLAAGDLMAIRALAGQLAEAGGARPGDFAVLLDTFQDSPEKIARRHLDLGLVRVDARGAIVEFSYLLKDGRFAPQDRPAYAPSALYRLLQDATLAWGDARAFARCLDHHADRFLADREAWRAGRDVEGNFGNAFFTADEMRKHLDAGVPPPLSDGWIARLERSVVARLAVLPGSAISVRS